MSPFVPVCLVSRDGFGSPVPRQPAHLHTQAEYGAYLRGSSRVPRRRPFIYLNRHRPSGQSRIYQVTQFAYRCRSLPRVRRHRASKTQGSFIRVVLPCLAGHHGPINMRLSFPHALLMVRSGHVKLPYYCPTNKLQLVTD